MNSGFVLFSAELCRNPGLLSWLQASWKGFLLDKERIGPSPLNILGVVHNQQCSVLTPSSALKITPVAGSKDYMVLRVKLRLVDYVQDKHHTHLY